MTIVAFCFAPIYIRDILDLAEKSDTSEEFEPTFQYLTKLSTHHADNLSRLK